MSYPIFLLPHKDIMITAKVEGRKIRQLCKTLFPARKRYFISDTGMAACLDQEAKTIICGQINNAGSFDFYRSVPFPEIIFPKSICLFDDYVVMGGQNLDSVTKESRELMATYNLITGEVRPLQTPSFGSFGSQRKCIDDLLVDGERIIAVDDFIFPKYLIEYDFYIRHDPQMKQVHKLPNNGKYERIVKGSVNKSHTVLLSTTHSMWSRGQHINVFVKGDYNNFIRISEWSETQGELQRKEAEKKYTWCDVCLAGDYIFISAYDNGVGIFRIGDKPMNGEDKNFSKAVHYMNHWNHKLLKILPVPGSNELFIFIFYKGEEDCSRWADKQAEYEYDVISKQTLLNLC